MLQIANAFFKLQVASSFSHPPHVVTSYRPGDYLKPGEEETQGLKNRLDERLAPTAGGSFQFTEQHGIDNDWEIGDCLAQWWRPNFETFMVSPLYALSVFLQSVLGRCRPAEIVHSGCTYNPEQRVTLRHHRLF
jgi:hypothetical protein